MELVPASEVCCDRRLDGQAMDEIDGARGALADLTSHCDAVFSDVPLKFVSWTHFYCFSGAVPAMNEQCEAPGGTGASSGNSFFASRDARGNMSGLRAWMPRSSGNLRAVDHESCEARALDAEPFRRVRRNGRSTLSAWLSRPEAYLVDKTLGANPAFILNGMKASSAAGSLLAAFLCAGVAGVGSAAAQSCLVDSNGDGHPLFASFIGRGQVNEGITSVASGELNGDGYVDAVTTHQSWGFGVQGVISILINEGDGMLTNGSPIFLDVDAAPRSVQLGDLNGDGALDLVYVDESLDTVAVYLNNGAASFTLAGTYPTGDEPSSVIIARLDGDADNDLAVLARVGDDVTILFNDGTGHFPPLPPRYDAGEVPDYETLELAHWADFGCPWAPCQQTVRFGPVMDTGDLDGDGDIDLGIPYCFAIPGNVECVDPPTVISGYTILPNTGNGAFGPPLIETFDDPSGWTTVPWLLYCRDLNADAAPDLIATAHHCNSSLFVALNEDGSFPALDWYDVRFYDSIEAGPYYELPGLALGDIDGNESCDLVVGHAYRTINQLLVNDGSGHFGPQAPQFRWVDPGFGGSFRGPILLDDFDGDGKLDLGSTVSRGGPSVMSVLLNAGTGSGHVFDQAQHVADLLEFAGAGFAVHPWYAPKAVVVSDIDGDDHADLITLDVGRNDYETHLNVVRNPGDGDFSAVSAEMCLLEHDLSEPGAPNVGQSFVAIRAGDMDGDGDNDLVVADQGRSVFLNGSWSNMEGSSLWVLLNDNEGGFWNPTRYDTSASGDNRHFGTTDAALGDIDGDTDIDVVAVNSSWPWVSVDGNPLPQTRCQLRVYQNDGTGFLVLAAGYPMDLAYSCWGAQVYLDDLDGDTDLDLVVNTTGESGVRIFRNDAGHFTQVQAITPFLVPWYQTLADLNGDGFQDIVVSWHPYYDPAAPDFAVYLNDGTGLFPAPRTDFSVGGRVRSPLGADLNGDGLDDLIARTSATEDVTVWINRGFPTLEIGYYAGAWPLWSAATGDLDNDGDLEIVAISDFEEHLVIFSNRGCPASSLPGDLDGSGCVELADLATLLSSFGCAVDCGASDIDGSGGVDIADLAILLANFGECLP